MNIVCVRMWVCVLVSSQKHQPIVFPVDRRGESEHSTAVLSRLVTQVH